MNLTKLFMALQEFLDDLINALAKVRDALNLEPSAPEPEPPEAPEPKPEPPEPPEPPPEAPEPPSTPQGPRPEVGMWYCEPRGGFPLFERDLKRLWEGGVSVLQSWDAGQIMARAAGVSQASWGRHQGEGWALWCNELARFNLKTLLFKPIWGAVKSRRRGIGDIEEMCEAFSETIEPGVTTAHGIDLGDDFAKSGFSGDWQRLIEAIAATLPSPTLPFYITNQMYDPAIYSHGAPRGSQMNGLRPWLDPFRRLGLKVVYLPQYYPWVGSEWEPTKATKWYEWLESGLRELLRLQRSYPDVLEIMPILQASAWNVNRGPNHKEMKQQLKVSLSHPSIKGVWLIGWNSPEFPGMRVFFDSDDEDVWEGGKRYAAAIREALGE